MYMLPAAAHGHAKHTLPAALWGYALIETCCADAACCRKFSCRLPCGLCSVACCLPGYLCIDEVLPESIPFPCCLQPRSPADMHGSRPANSTAESAQWSWWGLGLLGGRGCCRTQASRGSTLGYCRDTSSGAILRACMGSRTAPQRS